MKGLKNNWNICIYWKAIECFWKNNCFSGDALRKQHENTSEFRWAVWCSKSRNEWSYSRIYPDWFFRLLEIWFRSTGLRYFGSYTWWNVSNYIESWYTVKWIETYWFWGFDSDFIAPLSRLFILLLLPGVI